MDSVRTLALALDFIKPIPDGIILSNLEETLKRAIQEGAIDAYRRNESGLTQADVADAGLRYLAVSYEDGANAIAKANATSIERDRFDLATLAVGGLIVLLVQSELRLKRTSQGKWTIEFVKTPLRGSALADVVTKIADYFK